MQRTPSKKVFKAADTVPPPTPPPNPQLAPENADQLPEAPVQTKSPLALSSGACMQNLASAGVNFAPQEQKANDTRCTIVNPVQLSAMAFAGGSVEFPDRPILSCAYALQFSLWVAQKGTVAARLYNNGQLESLSTGPGYECRGRNGDTGGKLSEHASGNAVDIERMRMRDGSTVVIKDDWNPQRPAYAMLQAMRASACQDFTTVLGPGTNPAHYAHFHFDLAARKGDYRICQ
jgi:hypothetical protein